MFAINPCWCPKVDEKLSIRLKDGRPFESEQDCQYDAQKQIGRCGVLAGGYCLQCKMGENV